MWPRCSDFCADIARPRGRGWEQRVWPADAAVYVGLAASDSTTAGGSDGGARGACGLRVDAEFDPFGPLRALSVLTTAIMDLA